jgi:hypothetical protein
MASDLSGSVIRPIPACQARTLVPSLHWHPEQPGPLVCDAIIGLDGASADLTKGSLLCSSVSSVVIPRLPGAVKPNSGFDHAGEQLIELDHGVHVPGHDHLTLALQIAMQNCAGNALR